MHPSSPLLFRRLASRIHPQFPLSQRESQQLLQLLTTSFRNHLDKNHPISAVEDEGIPKSDNQEPSGSTADGNPVRYSSHQLADRHMSALLSHPLFSTKPISSRPPGERPRLHQYSHDPLTWLHGRFTNGSVTIETISGSLKVMFDLNNPAAYILKHSAGSKILEWSRASSRMNCALLCGNPYLRWHLCDALLLENRPDLIWDWASHSTMTDIAKCRLFRTYGNLVTHKAQYRTINPSMEIALKALSKGFTPSDVSHLASRIVEQILFKQGQIEISPDFLDRLSQKLPAWSDGHHFQGAVVDLFHPNKSSTRRAIGFFEHHVSHPKIYQDALFQKKRQAVALLLSLARRLSEEKNYDIAVKVSNWVKEKCSKEFGLTPEDPKSKPMAGLQRHEKDNLHYLDSLSLT